DNVTLQIKGARMPLAKFMIWKVYRHFPSARYNKGKGTRAESAMRMHVAIAFAAAILTGLIGAPSHAAPNDDAFAAYQKGDYATAVKLMRPLAEKGDVNAQYNM